MESEFFRKIGFSDKQTHVYMSLLKIGPSSVRSLSEHCGLNRGTVYDTLKWLKGLGLVDFFEKDTKQYFVALEPTRIQKLIEQECVKFEEAGRDLEMLLPELLALYNSGGERPVARYYEKTEIHSILEDVLQTCERAEEKMYRVYSASHMRELLYVGFDHFSKLRIEKGISVRVFALGEGGELRGLDERKWLPQEMRQGVISPSYIIIYPGKTAYISQNAKGEAVGVVITNSGIFETQKRVFDSLWEKL